MICGQSLFLLVDNIFLLQPTNANETGSAEREGTDNANDTALDELRNTLMIVDDR